MIMLTHEPINPGGWYARLDTTGAGSAVMHCAVVKPLAGKDGVTSHIEFTATVETESELAEIAATLQQEFTLLDVVLVRRLGTVAAGEVISLVAVSAPGSEAAFAACQSGIGRLRQMRSITKNEVRSHP